jgi:hypothetical protein
MRDAGNIGSDSTTGRVTTEHTARVVKPLEVEMEEQDRGEQRRDNTPPGKLF